MRQLFISDLHLGQHNPHLLELFHAFMEQFVLPNDTLYILGDFFEVWIGDDDVTPTSEAVTRLLSQHQGDVFLMHGNRDFLIGQAFSSQINAELIREPYEISLGNQSVVLLHGDSLCTDDIEYQQFKSLVRDPNWQREFLSRPLNERRSIAQTMREKSKQNAQMKAEDIMDVSEQAVIELFQQSNAEIIIHGHTHRQNRHSYQIDGTARERIVLGDWGPTASVLVAQDNQLQLLNFTYQALSNRDFA